MKLKEAIDDFEKAIKLGWTKPGIFSGKGQAYRLLKLYDRALV